MPNERPIITKACKYEKCKKEFKTNDGRRKYCDNTCRNAHFNDFYHEQEKLRKAKAVEQQKRRVLTPAKPGEWAARDAVFYVSQLKDALADDCHPLTVAAYLNKHSVQSLLDFLKRVEGNDGGET